MLYFRVDSQYFYALTKFTLQDTIIQSYIEAKSAMPDSSPMALAMGLLDLEINYEDPFIKRILFTEFYYDFMRWDIKRKEEE